MKEYERYSLIAKEAAAAALKDFKQEERKDIKKTVFRNTEKLLRNYNSFIEYYEQAKDSIEDVAAENMTFDCSNELFIESIRRSKTRTVIMVAHIEAALEKLKADCLRKQQMDKYKIIEMIYLQGRTADEVAEKLSCSTMTVSRWRREMVEDMSVKLFRVDGLRGFAS